MGATPAKFFPPPLPYSQSPDSGVLMQAKAPTPAPQQSFLPLNSPDPATQMQAGTSQNPKVGQFGSFGVSRMPRPQINRFSGYLNE